MAGWRRRVPHSSTQPPISGLSLMPRRTGSYMEILQALASFLLANSAYCKGSSTESRKLLRIALCARTLIPFAPGHPLAQSRAFLQRISWWVAFGQRFWLFGLGLPDASAISARGTQGNVAYMKVSLSPATSTFSHVVNGCPPRSHVSTVSDPTDILSCCNCCEALKVTSSRPS
jgi:hypothetical protein